MTCAIIGVPASNRAGGGANVLRSRVTVSIMSPPPCHGGIALEQRRPPVQHADTGRSEHLVPGEREEVAVQRLDVHRQVRRGLGPVHHGDDAVLARARHHPAHRIDRAERVGEVRHGQQPGAIGQQPVERGQVELAGVRDRHRADDRARLSRDELPGHDVGVVLHAGDQDLVARAELAPAPALRDEVDAFGRPAGEDDLAGRRRVEEAGDLLAHLVVRHRGALAQVVHPAVDVGVFGGVETGHRLDDRSRLLAGGRVVEVDERLAAHPLRAGSGSPSAGARRRARGGR